MQVTIQLLGQLGEAAGGSRRTVACDGARTAQELVRRLGDEAGERFKDLLFEPDGGLRACVLLFVGTRRVAWAEPCALREGDEILLATPIAGG